MRTFAFWLLGFICGFFIGGMVEDAQAFTPASNPYLERYERIATIYWGDVPDCEQVEYLWPAEDPFGTEGAVAYADLGGCRVWFVYWQRLRGDVFMRAHTYAFNCHTFVHEWGHLLGYDHDAAGFRGVYEHCDAAAAARYPKAKRPKLKPDPAPRPKRTQRRGGGGVGTTLRGFGAGTRHVETATMKSEYPDYPRAFYLICGLVIGFCGGFLAFAPDSLARYRPAVSVQDEAAISCSSPAKRTEALDVARQLGATSVRINAIENMNPLFGCDPVGAVRAVAAAGFRPHVTVVGSPAYAKTLVGQVGPLVDQWSVWNEINHSDFRVGYMEARGLPRDYRMLAVRMLRVFRRHDPGSRVLIGELAPHKDVSYINTMVRCAMKHRRKVAGKPTRFCRRTLRFDGIAVHAYAWFGKPESRTAMRGYLRGWKKGARRWARERRLCASAGRRVSRASRRISCRPVPIYVTEAGYMRSLEEPWGAPVYPTGQAASWLWRSWKVACEEGVKQMNHYNLKATGHQPRWDTALVGLYGPRPELPVLAGYINNAEGCRGRGGPLGPEHGPPVAVIEPARPPAVVISPPIAPVVVPPAVPVLVEPPSPPRLPPPARCGRATVAVAAADGVARPAGDG